MLSSSKRYASSITYLPQRLHQNLNESFYFCSAFRTFTDQHSSVQSENEGVKQIKPTFIFWIRKVLTDNVAKIIVFLGLNYKEDLEKTIIASIILGS